MTDSTQQTNQQTQTQSSPWAPTQGLLTNILHGIGGVSATPTAGQNNAIGALTGAAGNLPNFGGAVAGAANNLFGTYSDPNYLNPFTNPALSSALGYLNNQVSDNVNGQFAAAGRDLSPANTKALGYGLGSAEAPLLFNQYNQNVQNQQSGLNTAAGLAGQQSGLQLAPALAQLQAAQTAYGLPLSNIGAREGMVLPIAGLGGQTSGTMSGQTTYDPSIMAGILGGENALKGGLGLFGKTSLV